jgi:hypothetical protein
MDDHGSETYATLPATVSSTSGLRDDLSLLITHHYLSYSMHMH